jgi:uncharacterized membrane protein
MFNVSDSIKIGRPVSEVYNFTAEPCNIPRWQKDVSYIQAPDGLARKGEHYTEMRHFMGQDIKATYEVLESMPNSRLSFRSTDGPLDVHVDVIFAPDGSNTRLTTRLEADARGDKMMDEKMLRKQFEKQIREDDKELKNILEKMGKM